MSYFTASGQYIPIVQGGYVTGSGKVFPYDSEGVITYDKGVTTYGNEFLDSSIPGFSPNCKYNDHFDWEDAVTKLGSGSFSSVYPACKRQGFDCNYAAKVSTLKEPGQIKAYDNEIKAYKLLNQENFGIKIAPKMFDNWYCIQKDYLGKPFKIGTIILEKLGKNLSEIRALPADTKINLVYQLLTKIRALGNLGMYHYDIKPENVMISTDGKNLYITDYGVVGYFNRGDKQELDFYTGNMFLQAEPIVLRILSLPTEEPKKEARKESKKEEKKEISLPYATSSGIEFPMK